MNEQALLDYGFYKYEPNCIDKFTTGYSYWVKGSYGKKFCVHVRFWDFKQYGADHDGWDCIAYFEQNDGTNFRVERSCRDEDVKSLVDWYFNIYLLLECKPEENNDY